MIAEELGEELSVDSAAPQAEAIGEDGSEPLSLEPDVDAAVAQAKSSTGHANVAEEVAELQFLMLRGFHSEAEEAYGLLIAAHPGHPDLLQLGEELAASQGSGSAPGESLEDSKASSSSSPSSPAGSDNSAGADSKAPDEPLSGGAPDITVVTRTPANAHASESPTSPTFVEGTSPPAGGFAATAAVPPLVKPNTTPRLGIQAPERSHMPSSESLPTNPRMPPLDIDTTAVSKPAGVRMVMLGKRGEAVWERLLAAGETLEIGRDPAQPWGDDPHIEPSHARLSVIPGGGLRVEPMGRSGVYRQVDERLAVRDGDEFRVGESLLRYTAQSTGWGAVTCYPMSGTACSTASIGGNGLVVGRENADIELPEDTFVSGAHCRFSCRDEGLFIEDMGSANGTYSRLRPSEAVPYGSLLLVGQTQFKVRRVTP